VISENRYARAIVSQECVLIARIGDNLKPTIYKPNKDLPQIFLHSNVYALIPKKGGEINIEYLYYQLHSAFIQEQIGKRRLGAVMPYVSISGLKQIVVPYTKIGAQIDFVDLQKANLIAEERNRTEERIKALGYKEKTKQAESDILKTLTHQLRPTFLGLNNVTNRIDRIVQREHLGNLKEYQEADVKKISDPEIAAFIAKPDNFTIRQLLDKLASESRHISDILTNVDKVMNFKLSAEDFKEVDVLEFIQNYKREKEIDNSLQNMITVEGEPTIVLINEASFRELLDQLFLNAEKHAFQEENVQKIKKIQFVIKYDRQREVAAIEYSNNGAPYELTQKDFITAFEKGNKSKGSGIGGNYINRIVEAHKGILSVAENYKKGFLLTIELPTANIHEL
jgi:signal transduction histidine kinase